MPCGPHPVQMALALAGPGGRVPSWVRVTSRSCRGTSLAEALACAARGRQGSGNKLIDGALLLSLSQPLAFCSLIRHSVISTRERSLMLLSLLRQVLGPWP